ncbi:52 kDa repressor of the inhibitor of the protein kinase-like [Cydia fagiglandana]|uniref:52 kDa repressor of the inhibitor of the protein kinase-like n=1 Tax=Cydia fagiglandana TaxID=1458189 RepID=UPI002FEE43AF
MPKPRNFCAVDGCKSQKTKENLSFFSLPRDEERRRTWLEIIGRPDLLTTQTKSASHVVCSLHFDKSMIKYVPQLKPDAVPTKSLLNQPSTSSLNTNEDCKNVSTQTEESLINVLSAVTIEGPEEKSSCVQTTSDNASDIATQTTQELSDTHRKRKLRVEHKETAKKKKDASA